MDGERLNVSTSDWEQGECAHSKPVRYDNQKEIKGIHIMDGKSPYIGGNPMESAENLLETIKELRKFSKSTYKIHSIIYLFIHLSTYLAYPSKSKEQYEINIATWHNLNSVKI